MRGHLSISSLSPVFLLIGMTGCQSPAGTDNLPSDAVQQGAPSSSSVGVTPVVSASPPAPTVQLGSGTPAVTSASPPAPGASAGAADPMGPGQPPAPVGSPSSSVQVTRPEPTSSAPGASPSVVPSAPADPQEPGADGGVGLGAGGVGGGSSDAAAPGNNGEGGGTSGPIVDEGEDYTPCPSDGTPCKILPLGDSITNGVGSTDLGGYRSPLFERIVAAAQNATFTGSQNSGPDAVSGVPFPKQHEGRSGWTIAPGFSAFGADGISSIVPSPALDGAPHIILLMIGTNDVTANSGQEGMATRLEALLDSLVEGAPEALIVLATLTPVGWGPAAWSQYNSELPGIVQARTSLGQHLVLVDMSEMPLSGLDDDDVHPSDEGYSYMAEQWYAAIGPLLPN